MKQRKIKGGIRRGLALWLALGINLLPLQGLMPIAHATGGLNIPASEQPQVLIVLDNSQGMAGVLQATQGYASSSGATPVWSTNLSGAIMTGSGRPSAKQDWNSSSPPYYTTSGFIPPALGSAGTVNPFTVACGSSGLTAAAVSACATIGNNGYVDNSPSMLNGVEIPLASILSTPLYANNIQFGLETYATSTPGLSSTWVYYMSTSTGFHFSQNSASTRVPVNNPCYNNYSNSCYDIQYSFNGALGSNNLFTSPLLYISDTSDNPIINDVLYSGYPGQGYGATNAVGGTPSATASDFTLSQYEQQQIYVNFYNYSNGIASGYGPTSAGYISSSPNVWYSLRGYGYNANVSPTSGNLLVKIATASSANVESILSYLGPETFPAGNTVTASAGYSPVAGAFDHAFKYFQKTPSKGGPPQTCGKKYVIFITDGQPTMGTQGNVYPPLGSASANIFYQQPSSITASTWSNSQNNAVVEAVQEVQNLATNGIETYVLGVGSAVNPNIAGTTSTQQAEALQGQAVLTALAQAGGTSSYYSANTQAGVQAALNSIVANILGKSVVSSYAAPPSVTVGSLEFLLKNVNPVTGQGDLYAYPVTSNGSISSTASWTASQIMTTSLRSANVYTTPLGQGTNNSGAPQTFATVAATNSAAFGALPTSLTANDIANYTIDPSYSGGQYLGGRDSGWYIGLPSSAPADVLVPPDSANLLSSGSSYLSFAAKHAGRQNAVLFSDDDGFLYALGYNNTGSPTLLWGWMPGSLLPSLQNYQTFWQGNNMGDFSTIDAYNGSAWHTYVVGVANNGGIVYDLQLSGTPAPNLKSVVSQYTFSGYAQPQPSAPVYYQVQTAGASNYGSTWALFALNTSSGSYLGVLNVGTGAGLLDPLPFANTATPYIDASGNLYLGDGNGNVYEMSNSDFLSILTAKKATTIASKDFSAVGNYAPWVSSTLTGNVQFMGGTYYQGANYLRVQGPNGITLFKQTNGTWAPVWTAYSGGAGSWSGATYTPQSGSVTTNSISPLPAGSTISDQALISGGNVIVPVTIPAPANSCGFSTAAYYLYGLTNGVFPSGAFVSPTGTAITQGYVIGRGSAYTPTVSIFNGRSLLQGAASQNTTGGTSGFASALGAGMQPGGPVAWRLVLTQ
ncbi:type IV pilin biogenesis protein [Acidithiobacillus sp. IBUN Pt1247-S3]|uniref:type IV pilin biogenesis protein n=1 Tax=Acidithiobacillus sp. IBUN Pt1247-S3 TaxID=3166642 RepID=UPI0034E5B16C